MDFALSLPAWGAWIETQTCAEIIDPSEAALEVVHAKSLINIIIIYFYFFRIVLVLNQEVLECLVT